MQYIDGAAPKDGTVIDIFNFGAVGDSKLDPSKVRVDFRKFNWIGSISQDLTVCYVWHGFGAKNLAELIRYLAVNLVDRPDEVRVELVEERTANVYELEVAEVDLGKVIGRGGKTARALRTVVQAVAPRSRKRTLVEILE